MKIYNFKASSIALCYRVSMKKVSSSKAIFDANTCGWTFCCVSLSYKHWMEWFTTFLKILLIRTLDGPYRKERNFSSYSQCFSWYIFRPVMTFSLLSAIDTWTESLWIKWKGHEWNMSILSLTRGICHLKFRVPTSFVCGLKSADSMRRFGRCCFQRGCLKVVSEIWRSNCWKSESLSARLTFCSVNPYRSKQILLTLSQIFWKDLPNRTK